MKEKMRYTACPFCGSKDIKYFEALTKISIQEYIDTITNELSNIPDVNGIPVGGLLLESKKNNVKNKRFYFKEVMEEEIQGFRKMNAFANNLIDKSKEKK